MDYKPLFEYLTSGVLKNYGLSKTTLKRILRETNFLAGLPQDLGKERISCRQILELCRPAMALLCPEPEEGWLKECYLELAHGLFPDPSRKKLPIQNRQAQAFFLTVCSGSWTQSLPAAPMIR